VLVLAPGGRLWAPCAGAGGAGAGPSGHQPRRASTPDLRAAATHASEARNRARSADLAAPGTVVPRPRATFGDGLAAGGPSAWLPTALNPMTVRGLPVGVW